MIDADDDRLRPVRRAERAATWNGWTVGVFGILTIVLTPTTPSLVAVGVALVLVAWNELRGRDRLRALDPAGARRLGWNQVLLAGVIAVYCVRAIVLLRTRPRAEFAGIERMAGLPPGFIADVSVALYAVVLGVGVLFQLAMARFHFAREGILEGQPRPEDAEAGERSPR